MKLKSTVSKILTNKWVLNIVSLIALFNVIGYMIMGNFNNFIFFILLAVLVRYFSKNMIIVLGTPLLLVNLFAVKNGMFEGMENNSGSSSTNAPSTNTSSTNTSSTNTSSTKTSSTNTNATNNKKVLDKVLNDKNNNFA